MAQNENCIVPLARVQSRILLIRGQKVIIDSDLAALYGVPTKRLNEQVKRNHDRFPQDFMFQLSEAEKSKVVAICDHLEKLKYSPNTPYAFTEHGALMAATVLKTVQAVQISVYVVRAFVQLRRLLESNKELAERLGKIEKRLQQHDHNIVSLANTLNQLMLPKEVKCKGQIGFLSETEDSGPKRKAKKNSKRKRT